MDSKFFENEVIIVEKTSLNLGFQNFCENDFFPNNTNTSVASFIVFRENLKMHAVPKDPEQHSLFCQVLGSKHTAKVKANNSTVTVRFEMCGITKLEKADDGSEVLTLKPVAGSEALFEASSLISIKKDGKMERQIAFDCDTEFVERTDVYQYLGNDGPSDR